MLKYSKNYQVDNTKANLFSSCAEEILPFQNTLRHLHPHFHLLKKQKQNTLSHLQLFMQIIHGTASYLLKGDRYVGGVREELASPITAHNIPQIYTFPPQRIQGFVQL